MKIKRNYNFLSKQLKFFLIRIVLYLFTCLNTSYAMSDNALVPYQQLAEPGYDYNSLTKAFIKAVRTSRCPHESLLFIYNIKQISRAVEEAYFVSESFHPVSLTLFVLADVLYGLIFLPFRFTKNHIFRNITRSFAQVIFLAAVGLAFISEYCSFGVYTITKEMNAMNNEFNDLNSDLKSFLIKKMFLLGGVLSSINESVGFRTNYVGPDLKLKSSIIQDYGAVFLTVGYSSLMKIARSMFESWSVNRIIKLPRNYDSAILFCEVMILLGSNIYAASLPFVEQQNVESEIIFIDWLKNFRGGSAIIVLDDILNSPKVQDLLESIHLNMERNSSEYNIVLEKFLRKMYKEYNSIRKNGTRDTTLF